MRYLLTAMLLAALATFVACGGDDDDDGGSTGEGACPENPSPATDDVFQVDSPESGDDVKAPLTVRGLAAVFEAQFNIAILAADGTHIVDDLPARSSEVQTLAPFEAQVPFYVQQTTEACLQVYDISERDGSRVNVLQVPITLLPDATPGATTGSSASP